MTQGEVTVADADRFGARVDGGPRVTTVRLRGEVDIAVEDALREVIDDAVECAGRAVVIDLTDVAFLDSTGVQALLAAQAAAEAAGRRLVLRLGPPAERVLDLCGILPRFAVLR